MAELSLNSHGVAQVVDVIEMLFADIFKAIEGGCKTELQAVQQQFPFEAFMMKPMRFTFAEAVKVRGGTRADAAQSRTSV